jgi:molecular chaperone GrpE
MKSADDEKQGPVIRDRRRIDPVTGQVRDGGQSGAVPHGAGQAGAAQRAPGQPRPGRHSVSRPGGTGAASATGPRSDAAPGAGPAAAEPAPGPSADADRAADGPAPADGPGQAAVPDAAVRLTERTADLQRLQAEYANYRKRVERDRMAVREQALSNVLSELLPVLDDIGRAREHGELAGGFKSVAESLEAAAAKLGLTTYGENGDPFDPNLHDALMHSYSNEVSEPSCVQILQPGYKVGDRILRPARVAVAEPGDPAESQATNDPGDPTGSQDEGSPDKPGDQPGDQAPKGAD